MGMKGSLELRNHKTHEGTKGKEEDRAHEQWDEAAQQLRCSLKLLLE